MKKLILAASLLALTVTSAVAQKLKTYDKLMYVKVEQDLSDVSIVIENAVATEKYLKLKFKITNKTNDYILFKPSECKLMANGKEYKPLSKEKDLVVGPLDNDFRVINFNETGLNSARSATFTVSGIYKISSKSTAVEAPDFKLPVTKYDFSAGNFNVNNTKLYKQSDATDAEFTVSYTGDKIAAVFFTNATVLMPDNNEYSAAKPTGMFAKSSMKVIPKGGTEDFKLHWDRMQGGGKTMDMQFAPMIIKWHNTFCEITPQALPTATLNLEIDENLSK